MMELTCDARLVTLFVRNSFKRLVPSVVYLGIKARDPLEPLLVLATSSIILEFKVASNVKRVYKKEISQGRVGIEFYTPPHQILITTIDAEKLSNFLALLYKLMDRAVMERLEYIPILHQFAKPTTKSKSVEAAHFVDCDNLSLRPKKHKDIPVNLKERISKYLKEIDLPDCQLKEIPIEVGKISVERINLENNEITNENLAWLEELPIRKSLKCLNLAENTIDVFPSVLIDFESLIALNFRDNAIETIPCCIYQLHTLKYLNLSGNNLRYLPGTVHLLKLSEVDLTYNYLTSNVRSSFHPRRRNASKHCQKLRDLALLSVEMRQRRNLTYEQYPRMLLENLRQVSTCICGRGTVPHAESQFYVKLFPISFALTVKIHPQKLDFGDEPLYGIRRKGNGVGNVFLQYHFCGNCEDEYTEFGQVGQYWCFRLLKSENYVR